MHISTRTYTYGREGERAMLLPVTNRLVMLPS